MGIVIRSVPPHPHPTAADDQRQSADERESLIKLIRVFLVLLPELKSLNVITVCRF